MSKRDSRRQLGKMGRTSTDDHQNGAENSAKREARIAGCPDGKDEDSAKGCSERIAK